jgi:hypothetical protein
MSTPPAPLRSTRKPLNLSGPTTVLGLIFSLAFGVCAVSGISLSNGGNTRSAELLIVTALVIGAVCAAGLGVIAIVAMVRSTRSRGE